MASGIGSPLGIIGLILIIIGIIMLIIGIILVLVDSAKSKEWYVWALIIAGVSFGIAGTIMLVIALTSGKVKSEPQTSSPYIMNPRRDIDF